MGDITPYLWKGDNSFVPLGVYISVPFCRTKCTYCNFASDVFSKAVFAKYVDRVCSDIENASTLAAALGGCFDSAADSIYLGGGTPTVLDPVQLERLFSATKENFAVHAGSEITVECAPGTLSPLMIEQLALCDVNRVSLGLQSFVDREAAAVGRMHTREVVLKDLSNLRAAGISNINLDLIAGLPHQTAESWCFSVEEVIATGVPHVSVYMLEVDEESRLGRELIAGGTRYHAHYVPDENQSANFYEFACERLQSAGVEQYEISNFAKQGFESRHNLKYWTRQPYLGFGVDAHSMLRSRNCEDEAVRFSMPESLDEFVAGKSPTRTAVCERAALEECFFLGLRLTKGIRLVDIENRFGSEVVGPLNTILNELVALKLIAREADWVRLTTRGRMLSNEVFERFLQLQEASQPS